MPPKFGGEIFNVDGFKGSHDESGDKTFPVKTSLAVPAGSADVILASRQGLERDAERGKEKCSRTMLEI